MKRIKLSTVVCVLLEQMKSRNQETKKKGK